MIAYVIKNKQGQYYCGFDGFIGEHIFSTRIIDGLNTRTPTAKHCREEIKEYNLKDCKVVKVKIEEVSYSVSPKLPCKNCVCSRGEYGFDI